MANEKLIYASEARKAILNADPKLAYCIDGIPAVDAVEVVYCKECKYWEYILNGMGDCTNSAFHLDGHPDPTMAFNDYCSRGERKYNGKA